ncbi:hypothetical protein N7510_005205 [Penicillium lagena]|uniref:uncharacterized protein n=1 Tax=Penicillium lagena TaxID=94218 RepID=UPI00253F7F1C|nr:uncharacterized protein N7510_005205 [Penicillium lagena]KAJ5612011.1 hypothetical protein N7510_005205 [Penicillium lagena]
MKLSHFGREGEIDGRHTDGYVRQQYNVSISQTVPKLRSPPPHFAAIYLYHDDQLRVEVSPSMAGYGGTLFTPDVSGRFMEMAFTNTQASMPFTPCQHRIPPSSVGMQHDPGWVHTHETRSAELISCEWQTPSSRRQRHDRERADIISSRSKSASQPPTRPLGRTILRVSNRDLLRRYYERAFEKFQQLNCRIIAKSYIKLIEPRKQVHYPYNGRKVISGVSQCIDPEFTKPGWWPVEVIHREPDHLLKRDRLRLLVHILCELKDTHGVTSAKLHKASQDVRRQITPASRLEVLDEIHFVRQMEERFLDGKIDANTLLQVTQARLSEAIYQDPELSSHVRVAPTIALRADYYGSGPGDDRSLLLDEGDPLAIQSHQTLPRSPGTSDSGELYRPSTEFNAYTVGMVSSKIHQNMPLLSEAMHEHLKYIPHHPAQAFVLQEMHSKIGAACPLQNNLQYKATDYSN